MIFDVASICWEAHILTNILAALVETRDKYIIIIIPPDGWVTYWAPQQ